MESYRRRLRDGSLGSLKPEQIITLAMLTSYGVEGYVSDGEKVEPFVAADYLPPLIADASYHTSGFVLAALLSGKLGYTLTVAETAKVQSLYDRLPHAATSSTRSR